MDLRTPAELRGQEVAEKSASESPLRRGMRWQIAFHKLLWKSGLLVVLISRLSHFLALQGISLHPASGTLPHPPTGVPHLLKPFSLPSPI